MCAGRPRACLRTRLLRVLLTSGLGVVCLMPPWSAAGDLEDVKQRGVLRHMGSIYAGFVTPTGTGFDAKLIRGFAKSIGVRYEIVLVRDPAILVKGLTGTAPSGPEEPSVKPPNHADVIADVAAAGITITEERKQHLLFSDPTLPTQVWVLTKAAMPVKPIVPGENAREDVTATIALLSGVTVLGKEHTLLDPRRYGIDRFGGITKLFGGSIAELVPALLVGEGEAVLLDLPAASQALERWSLHLKVIGPVADWQNMGVAFARDSPDLTHAFNRYLETCRKDGTILRLVNAYFPILLELRPDFFATCNSCDDLGKRARPGPSVPPGKAVGE